MRLFIAEKPSLAKSLAAQLPGSQTKGNGFIRIGNDVVTWCFGHMLEQAGPEAYITQAQSAPGQRAGKIPWSQYPLPVVPTTWKLIPKKDANAQIKVIRDLMKEATEIVNAGDPDREGQLLICELLEHFGNRKPVKRIWVADLSEAGVKKALANLKDDREYYGLKLAAESRQRADWLTGMNLTVAYTLAGQRSGYSGTLSVGRVQTPTLGLVVKRDLEIENFKPVDYFVPQVVVAHPNGSFRANWKPVDDKRPGLDEDGRLIDRGIAQKIADKVRGQIGEISKFETKQQQEAQPKLYNLSGLQVDASRKYGFSAQQVLDACQSLYETHKLTTYPRTDCPFMPETQLADAPNVLRSVVSTYPEMAQYAKHANPAQKTAAWNDKKITAHHAIIPTVERGSVSKLNEVERKIYDLICRSYIAQFLPPHVYKQTSVEAEFAGERFTASGRLTLSPGWRVLYGFEAEEGEDSEQEGRQKLPEMATHDPVKCADAQVASKQTKPPARFTDGTLIEAMANIHKFVTDPAIKQRLKETAGIGTEATRASIIETLLKRDFLLKKGKQLISTPNGREFIAGLPKQIADPGLTGIMEQALGAIEEGKVQQDQFLKVQVNFITKVLEHAKTAKFNLTAKAGAKPRYDHGPEKLAGECPVCKQGQLRLRQGPKGAFWGCNRFPECKITFPCDKDGQPDLEARKRAA